MLNRVAAYCTALLLAVNACSGQEEPPSAQTIAQPTEFAEFEPIGDDEGLFKVAVVDYQRDDRQTVSLVSAVHIADAAHYEELQSLFDNEFDVVLYEMIADPDERPYPGQERPVSFISLIQRRLKEGLGPAYEPIKNAMLAKSPLGKVCVAEDVAQAIVAVITGSDLVTGHVLPVEGGMLIG